MLKKKRREQSKYDVGSKQEEQDGRYLSEVHFERLLIYFILEKLFLQHSVRDS